MEIRNVEKVPLSTSVIYRIKRLDSALSAVRANKEKASIFTRWHYNRKALHLQRMISVLDGKIGHDVEGLKPPGKIIDPFEPWRSSDLQVAIAIAWSPENLIEYISAFADAKNLSGFQVFRGIMDSVRLIQWETMQYLYDRRSRPYSRFPILIFPALSKMLTSTIVLNRALFYYRLFPGKDPKYLLSYERAKRSFFSPYGRLRLFYLEIICGLSAESVRLKMDAKERCSFEAGRRYGNILAICLDQMLESLPFKNMMGEIDDEFIEIIAHETVHASYCVPTFKFISHQKVYALGKEIAEHLIKTKGYNYLFKPLFDLF